MANQIFTVFGATGGLDNSVALALQASGYKVRALTRNPESEAAKALVTKGYDVIKVDMTNTKSLERAITGSYDVYAVTNFWGVILSSEKKSTSETCDYEISCGKTIVNICKKEDVKIFIYSGLEHVSNILGKPCHLFDSGRVLGCHQRPAHHLSNVILLQQLHHLSLQQERGWLLHHDLDHEWALVHLERGGPGPCGGQHS